MRGDWTRSNAVDQRCATSEELPICTKPSIHITQRNQDTVGITTTPSAINNMKMFRLKIIRSLKWSDGLKALKSRLSSWRLARWNIMLCQRKPSWLVQIFLSSKSDRGGNLLPCNFLSFSNNLAVWYWILSNTATLYRERTCFRRFFASKLPPFYLWSQNRE